MPKNKDITLRRNFSWTFIGNLIYSGCQWGMLVVLAKLGNPEMVGTFTLGLAVTAPVMMFSNLQLRDIQTTDAKNHYLFNDYLGLRLITTGLALPIILWITLATGYKGETAIVIILIGFAKGLESISDVFYGLLQKHEKMDRMAVSVIMKGPLSLLMLSIGTYISGSIVWGVVGLVIAWACILLIWDIPSYRWLINKFTLEGEIPDSLEGKTAKPRWQLGTIRKLIWLSLPLGLVMMLISLNANIPRYFLEQSLGKKELGVFAALAYLIVAGNMVVSALGSAARPRLAKYYAGGNVSAYQKLLLQLVAIACLLGLSGILVAWVAGGQILTIVYQPEYAKYTELLIWLMVTAGIGYVSSFLGEGMTAARYFRTQIPLFIIVTSTSAIASFWFIPKNGLKGAAIALMIAEIVRIIFTLGVIFHAVHRIQRYQTHR
ncbi:oligosaccharide flippase family protein [Anabaena sp. FACHB-1250]|uniref:Polysaccharide biosynthesis protein n=1 Tax=Dolichospermum planctonicum TaxID=136072 RepID=A0A480A8F4_9CYAN|nr:MULTISPECIES: oligosaccharide flippase family protein [Nostocales]MBD2140530.1 oligosaccharide flippase family protein [Anabaena sp. FACHB-1250]GCL41355.1 polysaccharide biosynthesis protein [Dolichospermum planctonicum]